VDTIEIFYEDIGCPARFRLLEKVIGGAEEPPSP